MSRAIQNDFALSSEEKRAEKKAGFKSCLPTSILVLAALSGFAACNAKSKENHALTREASAEKKGPLPRKDAFFGLHFDLHPQKADTSLGADISEENIAALLDRVRPDYVQYDCKGHAGYTGYPTGVGWPSPGIVRDSLAVWRRVTKEHGVPLFIHYSGVWDSKAIEEHPDWARIDALGKRDPNATSVFGPYADGLLIPQLQEVTAAYDLDGLWVDGECWAVELDYSPAALKAWGDRTGQAAAPKDRSEPLWLEWKMFQREAFENYLSHWVDALHARNPGLQITSNWMYTTFAPKPVAARLDFLSGDYSPSLSLDRARVEARYLASTDKPWDLMAWGFDRGRDQGWSLKSGLHLQQEAAVVLMQGGGFQVYNQPTRRGYLIPSVIEQLGQVADFCRERQALSHKSRTVPQVALLLSETSLWDTMDRVFSPWNGEFDELEGALHALLELHYSVDILAEHQLQRRLPEYSLVVIPDAHKLPTSFQDALLEYVRAGGALLLLGAQSARLFEPVLGVRFVGDTSAVVAELATPAGPVAANGVWQAVEPTTSIPAAFRHPTRDFRQGGAVAATTVSLGKGKITAVYGPLALAFFRGHHPGLRLFIGDLVAVLFPDPKVKVEGPSTLDLALRQSPDGRLCLHLLNRSNFPVPDRYNFISEIPAVGPIKVNLKLDVKPRAVRLMPEGLKLNWTWQDSELEVIIPSLHIHGMLVVD
jgi:hypothetical protein